MAKGNRPVYWLKITDKKNTKNRTFAGAAWVSDYNQLRIVLNPGVRVDWNDDVWLTLEPIDPDNPPRLPMRKRTEVTPDPEAAEETDERDENDATTSDIPF